MYNFNFLDEEELLDVFEQVLVCQNENEKITTIALTNKRMLFLDYITNDGYEALRIAKGVNFTKFKEVYYEVNLDNIKCIRNGEMYQIVLADNTAFLFNNERLYGLLSDKK